MIKGQNLNVNSGVQTNNGMSFQKHCTIYLFLEKYEELKSERYFIILEHLEDIIFGYIDNDLISKIETYQAKKSTNKWSLNSLLDILKKITETSQAILDESTKKSNDFSQKNIFATNHTIELKVKEDKVTYTEVINETQTEYKYSNLNQHLKDKICKGNSKVIFSTENKSHLETLQFMYIDLPRTAKKQYLQLQGMFSDTFGENIIDHKAALDTFVFYLNQIENTYNQGEIANLSDKTKRINSEQIEELINILTKKKLAYDFWRNKEEVIREALNVSLIDETSFELHYQNSFDEFKDLNEGEHQRIYNFIQDNKHILSQNFTDKDCIVDFYTEFNNNKSTTLRELQLKATIAAAYVKNKFTL